MLITMFMKIHIKLQQTTMNLFAKVDEQQPISINKQIQTNPKYFLRQQYQMKQEFPHSFQFQQSQKHKGKVINLVQVCSDLEYNLIKKAKLKYLSKDCFVEAIRQNVDQQLFQKFISAFEQQYAKESLQLEEQYKFRFPFVNEKDKNLQRAKTTLFIEQYCLKDKRGTRKIIHHNYSRNCSEQEKGNIGKMPQFLRQKQPSLSKLLAYEMTKDFCQQLKQVNKLIEQSIYSSMGSLIVDHFIQLLEFITLRDAYWQKFIDQNLLSKLDFSLDSYIDGRKNLSLEEFSESTLMNVWKQIFKIHPKVMGQNFREVTEQRKDFTRKCRQILVQGLSKVRLINCVDQQFFSGISAGLILINVKNHSKFSEEQFRFGLIKPYLYVCIVRQLNYYFFNEMKKGLIINQRPQSFGNKFVKMFLTPIDFNSKSLKLQKKQAKHNNLMKHKNCEQLQKKTFSLRQLFIPLIKDKIFDQQFYQIKRILTILEQMRDNLQQIKFQNQLHKQAFDLSSVYKLIDELIEPNKQICANYNEKKQRQYRIVLSLLFCNWIALENLPIEEGNRNQYLQYQQKLHKFSGERYFIKENEFIQRIIEQLFEGRYLKKPIDDRNSEQYIQCGKIKYAEFSQRLNNYTQTINNKLSTEKIRSSFNKWDYYIQHIFTQHSFFEFHQYHEYNFHNNQYKRLMNQKLSDELDDIFKIQSMMNYLQDFMRFYQLFVIINQLPTLFRTPQSGYDFLKKFIPNFKQRIYAKDLQLLKNSYDPWQRMHVGQRPHSKDQEQLQFYLYARSNQTNEPYISLNGRVCGTSGIAFWQQITIHQDELERKMKLWPSMRLKKYCSKQNYEIYNKAYEQALDKYNAQVRSYKEFQMEYKNKYKERYNKK